MADLYNNIECPYEPNEVTLISPQDLLAGGGDLTPEDTMSKLGVHNAPNLDHAAGFLHSAADNGGYPGTNAGI